jgi:hypothetical protein
VEAVIAGLNDNGIALIQKCYDCDNGVMVETMFVHESGEMLECGILHVPASKQDPQGLRVSIDLRQTLFFDGCLRYCPRR